MGIEAIWFGTGTSGGRCGGQVNPLNPELNPICYLLALLVHHFLHVSRIRVKSLTIRFYVRKGCTSTGVGVEGFVSLSQVLFRHVSTYEVIFRL